MKLFSTMLTLSLFACSSTPSTPEELAKSLFSHVNSKDVAGVTALFPTDKIVNSNIKCEKENRLLEEVSKSKNELTKVVEKMTSSTRFEGVEFISSEVKETMTVKVGEGAECKALKQFSIVELLVKFYATEEGNTKQHTQDFKLLKFNEKYYLMGKGKL